MWHAVLSKTTFGIIFVSIGWCIVRQRIPYAGRYGFKNQYFSKRNRDFDSWQNYLFEFHLCFPFRRLLRPMENEFYIKTTNGSSWT